MQKFKRFLRLFLLLLMIGMAAILPVPILFYGKDNLPKHPIEQKVSKENDDEIEIFYCFHRPK